MSSFVDQIQNLVSTIWAPDSGSCGNRICEAPDEMPLWRAVDGDEATTRVGQGCRTVSHFREALSVSLLRVFPGVPILSEGSSRAQCTQLRVSTLWGAHLSSRSLVG